MRKLYVVEFQSLYLSFKECIYLLSFKDVMEAQGCICVFIKIETYIQMCLREKSVIFCAIHDFFFISLFKEGILSFYED